MASFVPPKADFSEVGRRQGITKTGIAPTPADADTLKPNITWMEPSQKYALVNLANRSLRPKSVYPAFRVIGLFPTVEEATQFGRSVASSIPECNIYLVETCKWNLVPLNMERTPEEVFTKLESLLIAYYKNLVLSNLEFEQRREKNSSNVVEQNVFQNPAYPVAVNELEKRGVTMSSLREELDVELQKNKQNLLHKCQSTTTTPTKEQKQPQQKPPDSSVEFHETLLRADEDRVTILPEQQRYIVFSIMEDDNEPAFCLYGALPSIQESKGFQHFILKKEAPTHDTNCYNLGQWIYPESVREMDKYGLSTYPLDEQNRIMQWHRQNKNQQYSSMPGIDVMADRHVDESGNIVPAAAETPAEEPGADTSRTTTTSVLGVLETKEPL